MDQGVEGRRTVAGNAAGNASRGPRYGLRCPSRFGRPSGRFRDQVSRINDRLRLKEILRMVLKVQDTEDIEKALGN